MPTKNLCHLKVSGAALTTVDFVKSNGKEEVEVCKFSYGTCNLKTSDSRRISAIREYLAFRVIRQDRLAVVDLSDLRHRPNTHVVNTLIQHDQFDLSAGDTAQRCNLHRAAVERAESLLGNIFEGTMELKRYDLVVALYGGSDLDILRRTQARTETGDIVYTLIARAGKIFLKAFGKSCFSLFQSVKQFLVLS